jgi:hypothetical protein
MKSLWQNHNFRENALVLVLLFTGVHLIYGKTVNAGFVTDFTGLMERLEGAPFRDFLRCFGFPALHQVTNFFLYLFVKGFGTNGLPWYLVFSTLHVANGFLGFLLGKKIFGKAGMESPAVAALMAASLFLFSPYGADAVVWKVCFNFLSCTFLMLTSLLLLVKYLEQRRQKYLLGSHGAFFGALFTFELAISLPLLALTLAFWWVYAVVGKEYLNRPSFSQNGAAGRRNVIFRQIALPQAGALAGYFMLNKLLLDGWVGHYGEGIHLKFDAALIASNGLKYFTKYLFFWRDLPHGYKEDLMQFLEKPFVAWTSLALGMVILAAGIVFFKKIAGKLRATGLCWLLFFIALVPVSNLYVAWILQGENDRYGYFASLFFFMGLVALLQWLHRYIRYGLFGALLMISVFYLHRMTVYWQESARIVNGLVNSFRWQDAPEVYVLAFPENYQGIPMFKDFSHQNLALKHALKYLGGREPKGQFYQVAQFNMTSPEDGVSVAVDTTGVFNVRFNQWGNWWWLHGIGAWDYETGQYRLTVDGNGSKVAMKQVPAAGAVFIYSKGKEWEAQ